MQIITAGERLKCILTMKLLILFTVIACLEASARSYGQTVSLSLQNAPLEKAFKEIKRQTGYSFVYTRAQLRNTIPITYQVKNGSLKDVLEQCFRNQPLSFVIEDRYIVVQTKTAVNSLIPFNLSAVDVSGKVINETGEPLAGVTVMAKKSNKGGQTNERGEFSLKEIAEDDALIITSVGYYKEEVSVNNQSYFLIRLRFAVGSLEETIIKGYYSTSKRLNTGSVSKIRSEEIGRQPVSNPLAALQGSSPGLLVTQSNGLPGSNFNVSIRGYNSIQNSNSPLYIIDGVPFINDADVLTQRSVINASSPFNTIDPSQIESIEILKDADATAIYGSRGANGVILITTKKGKSEKIKTEASIYAGWGQITRTMKMMNTSQYLEMRREAFKNDAEIITPANGYDLMVWDTTRYTDFKKELIGNTSQINNATIHISGGSSLINFSSGINYYRESTVFPGNSSSNRFSAYSGIAYKSPDKKLDLSISSSYASDKSDLIQEDLTQYINLPPVLPELYDSFGNLNWSNGGFSFVNPLSATLKVNKIITDRFTANSLIQYIFLPNLSAKISAGYNQLNTDEYNNVPIAAQDPSITPTGTAFFGTNAVKSWILEPQVDYKFNINPKFRIQTMLGATLQENKGKLVGISATGYTNDRLLGSVANASSLAVQNRNELYRYSALFGRVNLNWEDKYLFNFTARRDGSSRFGSGNQFANFGAAGIAWIFSKEKFIANDFSFLSFGKLRFSYGTTGNDLIGNYQYLDSYSPTRFAYQGIPSLFPTKLYNSEYSWEQIRKINIGLELGFLNERILLTADWFSNRSSNQIINYSLPGQTGFTNILKNFPGVVQNNGIEVQINTLNIRGKRFSWKSNFNFTMSRNKLVEFPGLSTSSYAQRYIIGKPLNLYIGAKFAGVDPATGVYQFYDKDKNLTFSPSEADYSYAGTTDPKFYGGFSNSITYRNWELSFLFDYRRQMGLHPIYSVPSLVGDAINRPEAVLDRWQLPNDLKPYQRFTQTYGTAGVAIYPLFNSDAVLTDASFVKLRNLSLSYSLSALKIKKKEINRIELFLQAQNLFVITNYKGPDPETQRVRSLPPLRRIAIGGKLSL